MWFIGVEVEQETSAPPPEKNPGSAPVLHGRIFDQLKHLSGYFAHTEPFNIFSLFTRN